MPEINECCTTTEDAPPVKICGRVMEPDGTPKVGVTVHARRKALTETLTEGLDELGSVDTDERGCYTITLGVNAVSALFMRATDGEAGVIATSPVTFNAAGNLQVDLVTDGGVFKGTSEFNQIDHALAPLLDGTEVRSLDEAQVRHLAGVTGIDPHLLALYTQAAKQAHDTDLPAGLFYAAARAGLPFRASELVAQDRAARRAAFAAGFRRNVVSAPGTPEDIEAMIDDTQSDLIALEVTEALRVPEDPSQPHLRSLLETNAGLTTDHAHTFVERYANRSGTVAQFWTDLAGVSGFDTATIATLKQTIQFAALTGHHPPLIAHLLTLPGITTMRDLATYDVAGWSALITAAGGTVPELIKGNTDAEKVAKYAATLAQIVETAFPTAYLAARMTSANLPANAMLIDFFGLAPEFDLATDNAADYIDKNDGDLEVLGDLNELHAKLARVQRVYRIVPPLDRHTPIQALLSQRLDSATAIHQTGRAEVRRRFEKELGVSTATTALADSVFDRASHVAHVALSVFANNAASVQGITLPSLAPRVDFPNYAELFGSVDFCPCTDCRSVYSPAAYLVDILHFLRNRPASGGNALDQLFARRPEIGAIDLSCDNTNVTIPYIDLVNEILEDKVAGVVDAAPRNTTGTAAERRLSPEYENPDAYEVLKSAVYPWNLPFDLQRESVRAYLAPLGISRERVMRALQTRSTVPSETAIADEVLGFSENERAIFTGTSSHALHEFWGMDASGFEAAMVHVPTVMRQSGLTFEALQVLLATKFVNDEGTAVIAFPPGVCDVSRATINGLTRDHLDRMHRFVRLQRHLGWTERELDYALQIESPTRSGILSDDVLDTLAEVQRVATTARIPRVELLAWWQNVETRTPDQSDSQYAKVFLEVSLREIVPSADRFRLNADGDELATPGVIDEVTRPRLIAALGITGPELDAMIADNGNDSLDLENLSRLYRIASMARAAGLKIADALTLAALSGTEPFIPAEVTAARDFLDQARAARRGPLSIALMDYLVRHRSRDAVGGLATDEGIAAFVLRVRDAVVKARPEEGTVVDDETTGELLASAAIDAVAKELKLDSATTAIMMRTGVRVPGTLSAYAVDALTNPDFLAVTSDDYLGDAYRNAVASAILLLRHPLK